MEAFIKEVREFARQNYRNGGDTIVEGFTDAMIVEQFKSMDDVKQFCSLAMEGDCVPEPDSTMLCQILLSKEAVDYLFSVMNGGAHTNGECNPYVQSYEMAVRTWGVTKGHGELAMEVMGQLVNAYPDFKPEY